MTQVSKYPLSKTVTERIFAIFLKSFVEIKNSNDADQFISDLLTHTEKIMLAKRLAIAFLLEKGYEYRAIQQLMKVSSATIMNVNAKRKSSSQGYKKLIEKIVKQENILNLFENVVSTAASIPAALERGKGTWSTVKRKVDNEKRNNRKPF